MNYETDTDSPKHRLLDLVESTAAYMPARATDTLVDLSSGDTILSPKAIEAFDREAVNEAIEKWSSFAVSLGTETVQDRAMLSIAHDKIAHLTLTNAMFDQVLGEEDRSEDIEALESQLYGHYNPDLYFSALKQKIDLLMAVNITDPDLVQARALLIDDLESLYQDAPENIKSLERPHQETLDQVGDWLHGQHPEVQRLVEQMEGDVFDAQQIKQLFDDVTEEEPALKKTGWVTKIVERSKAAISTYTSLKEVHISSHKTVKRSEAVGKTYHETLGHALRSANAELAGDDIGRHGTATYGSFEESLMIALEQCANGDYDPNRGLDNYLVTGLAITSHLPSDKVAQLLGSIRQIKGLEDAPDGLTPKVVASEAKMTSSLISRVYAGMTDVDQGIAHRKEINYLHGLNNVWSILNHLAETHSVDEGMEWLMSAKFNPYSAEDRELVETHHPMPTSLYTFFESY